MLCLGFAQVYYMAAIAAGLEAGVVKVTEYAPIYLSSQRLGHVACLVMFEGGRSLMADQSFVSASLGLAETFAKDGLFLLMRDASNPMQMHTRIRILDEGGIKAQLQRNLGRHYEKAGDLQNALQYYNHALSTDPASVTAYCSRGTLFDSLGDYDKALADYHQAITLRPKMALLDSNRGSTYLKKGDRARAVTH